MQRKIFLDIFSCSRLTSVDGQCSEFVLGNSESGVVMSGYSEHVPGCGFEIENDEVASGLDIVRDLIPFNLIPKENKFN